MPTDILEIPAEELTEWVERNGEPSFRAAQIAQWVYKKFSTFFDDMTTLPIELRKKLKDEFIIGGLAETGRLTSEDDMTRKLLFELEDANRVESVWMSDDGRLTFCISSQSGCRMGCRFCATGAMGFKRNLRTGEILGQISALAGMERRLGNVVFMGMGEPLDNLGALIPAIEALADPKRFGLSASRIAVSTSGVVDGIRALGSCRVHPNLALSLNSPFDDQRSELMPVNKQHPLKEVIKACLDYKRVSRKDVLLEYVLLDDANTSPDAARKTARIARSLDAIVNLIAFNPVSDSGFRPPEAEAVRLFRETLEEEGARVTQRYRRGRDIEAGCGQLAGKNP